MCYLLNQINILLPEIMLVLAGLILLLIGVFKKTNCLKLNSIWAAIAIFGSLSLLYYKVPTNEIYAFNNLFKSNLLIKSLKYLLLISSIFYLGIYSNYKFLQNSQLKSYEFLVIVLFAISGMMLMLSANNFLSFYISVELQSLCLYVLTAFERDESKASEAGLKYFILGSFASGLMLFGISLIYGFTGNTDFSELTLLLSQHNSLEIPLAITIGIILFLIGLFFKVSAAPFHMWTPDVYQGSPIIVTCFFATISKISSIGILFRFTSEVIPAWQISLQPVLIVMTIASLLTGAIAALKQEDLKRLLSYSSIGHVGFMLLAISAFQNDGDLFLYLVIYTSMNMAIFALIMALNVEKINDLAGLSKQNPIIALAFAFILFSLAGIPPFAGFFAKFYVLKTAVQGGLYISVFASFVATVISAYYYLRIIKVIYFDNSNLQHSPNLPILSKLIILALVGFNFAYILF